jgi:GMP synthase-like glutamine amidotransferase
VVKLLVIQNQAVEPIGALGEPLYRDGVEIECWRAWESPELPEIDSVDGLVILGGAANPDESSRLRWLKGEKRFLEHALELGVPTLGICLGAELLASILGARVFRLPMAEIGWIQIEPTTEAFLDPVGNVFPGRAAVFQWHSFGFDLPPGAVALACGGASLPAFRFGAIIWGLQFHLDADGTAIDTWIEQYTPDLDRADIDATSLRIATKRSLGGSIAFASAVGQAFLRVVTEPASRRLEDAQI